MKLRTGWIFLLASAALVPCILFGGLAGGADLWRPVAGIPGLWKMGQVLNLGRPPSHHQFPWFLTLGYALKPGEVLFVGDGRPGHIGYGGLKEARTVLERVANLEEIQSASRVTFQLCWAASRQQIRPGAERLSVIEVASLVWGGKRTRGSFSPVATQLLPFPLPIPHLLGDAISLETAVAHEASLRAVEADWGRILVSADQPYWLELSSTANQRFQLPTTALRDIFHVDAEGRLLLSERIRWTDAQGQMHIHPEIVGEPFRDRLRRDVVGFDYLRINR